MNMLFTLDRAYLPVFVTCVRSFLRFPRSEGYRIYILHSDLTEDDVSMLRRRFGHDGAQFFPVYVDPGDFGSFPDSLRYPKTMYYRVLASKYLPNDIDRVLYLDPDIVVIKPLDELYSKPFGDAVFYACTHVHEFLTRVNQLRLGIRDDVAYINTGVMLMNLAALRSTLDERRLLEYVAERGPWFTLPDQDIITALYGKRTILLDTMKYNLSDRILNHYNADPANPRRGLDWVRANTVIIHYFGPNKPWKKNYIGLLDCFYRELEPEIRTGSSVPDPAERLPAGKNKKPAANKSGKTISVGSGKRHFQNIKR